MQGATGSHRARTPSSFKQLWTDWTNWIIQSSSSPVSHFRLWIGPHLARNSLKQIETVCNLNWTIQSESYFRLVTSGLFPIVEAATSWSFLFLYSFLEFFEGHFKGEWIAQWTIIIIIIIIIIYSVKIIKYGERER